MWSGALESSDLLLSYPTTSLSPPITNPQYTNDPIPLYPHTPPPYARHRSIPTPLPTISCEKISGAYTTTCLRLDLRARAIQFFLSIFISCVLSFVLQMMICLMPFLYHLLFKHCYLVMSCLIYALTNPQTYIHTYTPTYTYTYTATLPISSVKEVWQYYLKLNCFPSSRLKISK